MAMVTMGLPLPISSSAGAPRLVDLGPSSAGSPSKGVSSVGNLYRSFGVLFTLILGLWAAEHGAGDLSAALLEDPSSSVSEVAADDSSVMVWGMSMCVPGS